MHGRDSLYINGAWVSPHGKETIDVINPATEQVIGSIPEGTAEDAAAAEAAARAAFEQWAVTPREERAALLTRLHHGLAARSDEIATVISEEMGMPIKL